MRYDFLITVIRKLQPRSLVEIGVHKGLRAELMCLEALKYQSEIAYTGFDLWEQLQDHELVSNGKGPSSKGDVERRLRDLRKQHKGLNYELIQGDTAITVPELLTADLVFIDADHRDWAIQRDYDRTKHSRIIVLDDVYDPEIQGLGANNLKVDSDCMVKIYTSNDVVKKTRTRINLMVVSRDPLILELGLKDRS